MDLLSGMIAPKDFSYAYVNSFNQNQLGSNCPIKLMSIKGCHNIVFMKDLFKNSVVFVHTRK